MTTAFRFDAAAAQTQVLMTRLHGMFRGPRLSPEMILLLASLLLALFANGLFWNAALAERSWSEPHTWLFAFATLLVLATLHFILLGLLTPRVLLKPLMAVLIVVVAAAANYMREYTVYFDTAMLRNVLHTEPKEAMELLSTGMVFKVLVSAIGPLGLLLWVQVRPRSWRSGAVRRALALGGAMLACVVATSLVFPDLSSLLRNHKEVRFLVTPANLLVSSARVLAGDARRAGQARIPVGQDARVAAAPGTRPRLLVLVVGETVRAQNWGLNGYQRQTTPELASLDLVNFPDVTACGTSTEVSVPCMFSAVGRRNYSEARIRDEESLLHVLDHAGIATAWIDNQTGSKTVSEGLPEQRISGDADRELCDGSVCLDAILLPPLQQQLAQAGSDRLVVLHPLGNHGPAYSHRYPADFTQYQPVCATAELGSCSDQQILNAYDNAVLYTDHLLASVIEKLRGVSTHDVALIYVSDHGESLGEHGLYLHGVPYAIAPEQQTRVPMVVWLSDSLRAPGGIDQACLAAQADRSLSHDNLFHSVLGLLRVETAVYEASLDVFATCRTPATLAQAQTSEAGT